MEITLPGLMPKRTRRVNTTFLTDPLYASLEAYTKEHPAAPLYGVRGVFLPCV